MDARWQTDGRTYFPMVARKRPRRGLGMVELLIALSISASVLAAVGFSVDAAFRSYKANQEQTILMQRGRVAQHYLTTLIRTSDTHAPRTASAKTAFAGGATVTDTGVDMYDADDQLLSFFYDAPNKRVRVTHDGVTHTLASGVEAFAVKLEPMRSANAIRTGGGWDLLKRATVTITVRTDAKAAHHTETTGDQAVTLIASVMPRRNAW